MIKTKQNKMSKQTGVEWFLQTINNSGPVDKGEIDEIIKKAIEIDKNNIIEAYINGRYESDKIVFKERFYAEKYYNRTYKNQIQ
jgi:hypothetical protein